MATLNVILGGPDLSQYYAYSPDVINVLEYGAAGNGTVNDYPAILAALNAVDGTRRTIYFPPHRTYRIASAGVHGIHLDGLSNVTIIMGEGSVLLMDNMVDGLAVSHGVFVEGPCSDITLAGLHVKYATMAVSRQGWAPFYFLGANVGTGNQGTGGWYRGEIGGENVELIEAGSVRNLTLRDCTSENSPSVFVGLVNTDGVWIENFKGIRSWADGLYNRCFRRHIVNGVELIECGDDCISVGTEESDLEAADIDNDFHGEGSVFSNISFDRSHDGGFLNTSGGIALLGVRDVAFSNIVCRGKYRALRAEHGPETTGVYSGLNLSFLANKGVVIDGVEASGATQAINVISKQIDIKTTDPKWWKHSVLISNVTLSECEHVFDFSGMSGGLTVGGYVPKGPPVVCGFTFDGIESSSSIDDTFTNISGINRCVFRNIRLDCQVNIKGSALYSSDPDALDDEENPVFPDNDCLFENFTAAHINVTGLKRSRFDNLVSDHSPQVGIAFVTCADIEAPMLTVRKPNRADGENVVGCYIDRYSKRFNVGLFTLETDDIWIENALSINNSENHWVARVSAKTDHDRAYFMVSDHAKNHGERSQVGLIDVYHTAVTTQEPRWRSRMFSRENIGQPGDVDVTIYPEGERILDLKYPLTADRTVTLSESAVNHLDSFTISRLPSSTGDFSVIVEGLPQQSPEISEVRAEGSFLVVGGSVGSGNKLTNLFINDVDVLTAEVPFTQDNYVTATAIAAAVNPALYESFAVDYLVFIRDLAGNGAASNGHVINPVTAGDLEVAEIINLAGGVTAQELGPEPEPYPIVTMPPGQSGTVVVRFTGEEYELSSTTFATIPASINSTSSLVIVEVGDSPTANAQAVLDAYALAKTLAPNGAARSATNRARLLLPPGLYDFGLNGQLVLDTQYIDVFGLFADRSAILTAEHDGENTGTIRQFADDVRIENLRVLVTGTGGGSGGSRPAAYFPSTALSAASVRYCDFLPAGGSNNYSTRAATEYAGRFEKCTVGNDGFAGGPSGEASGVFVDCVGGDFAFANPSGVFTRCTAGDYSFGGNGPTGTFTDCTGGDYSFGGGETASGNFLRCRGGAGSFAGDSGTASGTFTDCEGGDYSFGGGAPFATAGTASGTFTRCVGGNGSFAAANTTSGTAGTLSGRLLYCRLTTGTIPTVSGGGKVVHCINGTAAAANQ